MTRSDSQAIPFGAEVYENGTQIGNMGGAAGFVRGINDSGELTVRWFEKPTSQLPGNVPVACNTTDRRVQSNITVRQHYVSCY